MVRSLLLLVLVTGLLALPLGGSYLLGVCTQGCRTTLCNCVVVGGAGGCECRMYEDTKTGMATNYAEDDPGVFAQLINEQFPLVKQNTTLNVWSPKCGRTCGAQFPQECTGLFAKQNLQAKGIPQMWCTQRSGTK
jgi:hypothetical protein